MVDSIGERWNHLPKTHDKVVERNWRSTFRCCLPGERTYYPIRVNAQGIGKELVRVLYLDPVGLTYLGREMPQVGGHYDLGPANNRRGQNVAILRIIGQSRYERFIPGDFRLWEGLNHVSDAAVDVRLGESTNNASPELVQDFPAPPGPVYLQVSHPEQRVSQGYWM